MVSRIIDKIIMILIASFAMVTSGTGTTGLVVSVLVAFFFAFMTEIWRRDLAAFSVAILACAAFLITRRTEILPSLVIFAYSFASYPNSERFFTKDRSGRVIAIFISEIILTLAFIYLMIPNWELLVTVPIAVILGSKTLLYDIRNKRLSSALDDTRYDAIMQAEKRRTEREKEDEKIYMATLEERNRIAREIHDNIGHMLTRTLVQMEAIKIVNSDENIKGHLDSVSDTLNEAMTAVRKSVHELHSESIDLSISINEAVKALPERFECKVETVIESAIPNDRKTAILAILKESITNIVKYSNGNKVKVEFIENPTFWRLLVEDNGVNKTLSYDNYSSGGGIGIANIISRCEDMGGRAAISSDEHGFRVRVTIPK